MTDTGVYIPGSNNEYEGVVLVNPATGAPYASATSGYTGATATAPGANGATATPVQGIAGGVPITANLGTLNGAALDASVQAVKTALGSPFQAGASIGNTAFGISGQLPPFASTPTVNLGTLGGAALDTSVQAVKTALGSPFQANGSIGNTSFGATQSGPWAVGLNAAIPAGANLIGSVNSIPSTGSTLTTSQPSVTSTAAALAFSGTVHREIANPAASTASIFIGASGVTTTTGWEIPPGSSYDVSRFSGTVYAVAASPQTVRLISY